jgi:glycosyltransferase involved in cell wall biosynthesis
VTQEAAVCAIIPAYNNRETIVEVVRGALAHLDVVIVVDDGSTDGTAEAAREAGAEVVVLGENRGKGNALRVLFAESRRRGFSAAIALDADGQHDAGDIPAYLQAHREDPAAVITGSRMGAANRIPSRRLNSMLVARFFISLAANQFIEDTQCGFRLYPLDVIQAMDLLTEGYVTETELLIKAGDSGRRIRSLPIKALYPPGQATHFRTVRDVAAISRYVISYLMTKWGIEALRPGAIYTYGGPGTGRDVWGRPPILSSAFEWAMVLVALPLTALYGLWHSIGRLFSIPVVRSLSASGLPLGRLLGSVMLLPVLLMVAIVDSVGNRLGIRPDLSTRFVNRHYCILGGRG